MKRFLLSPAVTGVALGLVGALVFGAALFAGGTWAVDVLEGGSLDFEALASREPTDTKIASVEDTRLATVGEPAPLSEAKIVDLGPEHFDLDLAMAVIKELTSLGPRVAGSEAEAAGFDALEQRLQDLGYAVARQSFAVPKGTSRNVIAEKEGTSDLVVILGAHVDTKDPSPGGNDNASGCGVVMSLASTLKDVETDATIRFVFFGAEEISGPSKDDHHFGSKHYVETMSAADKESLAAMISVDMVGYGPSFHVRTMDSGPQTVRAALLEHAGEFDYPLTYLKDPGWSDHEPFESAGLPAAWIEWRDDPDYHTARDTYEHVVSSRVRATGELVAGFVLSRSEASLLALQE